MHSIIQEDTPAFQGDFVNLLSEFPLQGRCSTTDIPAYSDTLGTRANCHYKQVSL